MKNHIFISKENKGWYELEIPDNLLNGKYEQIRDWAGKIQKEEKCKGLLISENPDPFQ